MVYYYLFGIILYMAVSHKDWELPNSGIWLAEIDMDRDRHLDWVHFAVKKLQTKVQKYWLFSYRNISGSDKIHKKPDDEEK